MGPLTIVIIEDEEAHFQLMKQAIDKKFPGTSVHHFGGPSPCLESLDEISLERKLPVFLELLLPQ
jgi:hypothetical protein